jgi:hypothetical protein
VPIERPSQQSQAEVAAHPFEVDRHPIHGQCGVAVPPSVIDMLVAQHRTGINHLSMRVSWPGMGQDDILASIELLGRQVLPEVRRRTAVSGL